MPSPMQTQDVELRADGPQHFDAYVAAPASGIATGLVIASEMFGLNQPMRDVAQRYAAQGYAVLVPNLFWRSEPSRALAYEGPDRQVAWDRLAAFDSLRAADDLGIAAAWLRASGRCNGRVGVLGFCMGGRLAFLAAARAGVDGAVSLYGLGISKHLDQVPAIACPVQLHYGLRDEHVPRAEIDAVTAGVAGNPRVAVHLYPEAGHSFFNPVRPTYDAAAADLAGRRIGELLARL
jgi:carboxymethylenebutenolidase